MSEKNVREGWDSLSGDIHMSLASFAAISTIFLAVLILLEIKIIPFTWNI